MAEVPRIAILASSSGTTAEYVVHATETGVLQAKVDLVITNNSSAGVLNRMERLSEQYQRLIPTVVINGINHPSGYTAKGEQTNAESSAIADLCEDYELVVLLGYMKKVRGDLLDLRVVNTHPGPLPDTEGLIGIEAQRQVLRLGLTHSAQTFHWVEAEYDKGDKIAVHEVPVMRGDTAQDLFDAVQTTEKTWLPVDLNNLLHM